MHTRGEGTGRSGSLLRSGSWQPQQHMPDPISLFFQPDMAPASPQTYAMFRPNKHQAASWKVSKTYFYLSLPVHLDHPPPHRSMQHVVCLHNITWYFIQLDQRSSALFVIQIACSFHYKIVCIDAEDWWMPRSVGYWQHLVPVATPSLLRNPLAQAKWGNGWRREPSFFFALLGGRDIFLAGQSESVCVL